MSSSTDIAHKPLLETEYDEAENDKSMGYGGQSMDTRNHSSLLQSKNRSSSFGTPPICHQECSGDYVDPLSMIQKAIEIGAKKADSTRNVISISTLRVILKAMMSGSYLSFSISLTVYAISLEWDPVSGAMLFAMGFVMLILMGNDLATGNFALVPMAYFSANTIKKNKKNTNISIKMVLINWIIVYCGNFIGALLFLFLLWGGMTHFGQKDILFYQTFKNTLCQITGSKTMDYKTTGIAGWFASVFNGILCNWMVTMAVLLSLSSKSTIGKIFAMYIPITLFICLGFEHSIVNLFLLPAGLTYKCNTYNFVEWWIWNQIPVTLGNIFGGTCLTAIVYLTIWKHKL